MNRHVIAIALALAVPACAQVSVAGTAEDASGTIKGSANESVAMKLAAKGVQIYECRASVDGAGTHAWVLVGPEAELFDADGLRVGRHYAGPQWEAADGSRIAGTVRARADAPRSDAIPWLLLAATSVGGEGVFSKVTSVQRVNTVGGVAPQTGCSAASVGTLARVPYTATYNFLAMRASYASPPAAWRPRSGAYSY
ncbi:MAG TPA: DUF3455 domain-containing protein [Casimicrobiaceae bacterium]|nr:DUF3455 domain-containing protein [Casimicrobiaceae bacterium]